jgi:hypothetical protein
MMPAGAFKHRPASSCINEPGGDHPHDPQIKVTRFRVKTSCKNKQFNTSLPGRAGRWGMCELK